MTAIIPDIADTAIANWLEARLRAALARTAGPVALAVPGGATPFPILARLAARPLEWARVAVWPTDDRLVPHDHPASNTGKLIALFAPTGAAVVDLAAAAAAAAAAAPPRFALVWLGMGADGHVASLFPNTDPQPNDPQAIRRLTPDPLPPEAPFDRITLTLPALLCADELLLVTRGEDKRAVLADALAGRSDLPVARLLRAARGPLTCFT
jgi:6-phosphogluconolactonase